MKDFIDKFNEFIISYEVYFDNMMNKRHKVGLYLDCNLYEINNYIEENKLKNIELCIDLEEYYKKQMIKMKLQNSDFYTDLITSCKIN
jgi:hypothetical protein